MTGADHNMHCMFASAGTNMKPYHWTCSTFFPPSPTQSAQFNHRVCQWSMLDSTESMRLIILINST